MIVPTLVYDLIVCLIEYVIIYQFLFAFFERRSNKWYMAIIFVLPSAVLLAIVNQMHNFTLNISANTIFTIIMCLLIFKGSYFKRSCLSVFSVVIAATIEFITLPIVAMLQKERLSIVAYDSEFIFLYSVFNQIVFFIILQSVAHIFAKRLYITSKTGAAYLLLLPLTNIFEGMVFIYLDRWIPPENSSTNIIIASACLGMLIANIVIFNEYGKSLERYNWEAKYNVLERRNQAQLEYYFRLDEHLQSIKVERHDFNSNL